MGAVQWNCSELEGLSNALLFCANSTDLWSMKKRRRGSWGKQLCCLWLPPPVAAQQQPEDNNAASNSVPSCLDLHKEIWVLRREQSVTFLPEFWTISGNLHSSHQPATASVKGLAKTCTNLDTLHKIHVICSVYPQKNKCSAGKSPRRSNFPTLNFKRCRTQRENNTNYLRQLMSGQNLLPQPQQCWAALNPSLSCFPLIWQPGRQGEDPGHI